MKKTVYIETSIASYLTGRPTRDLLVAAMQQITLEWWNIQRHKFDVYVSELVVDEIRLGDADAAKRRLASLQGIASLATTDETVALAKKLIGEGAIPDKATDDAMHVALAAVHGVDYLLTWNCRHIDNAESKPLIRRSCAVAGHPCPEICNPRELMGGEYID